MPWRTRDQGPGIPGEAQLQEVGGVRVREGGGGGTVPDARSELEAVVRMNDGRWTVDDR